MASNSSNNSQQQQLPIDGDGVYMLCKQKPSEGQRLTCVTCITPWHVACLLVVPETLALAVNFECPDCSGISLTGAPAPVPVSGGDLISKICAIEAESSLTEIQKAKRKQQLLSGKAAAAADSENDDDDDEGEDGEEEEDVNDVLDILSASFMCAFCWKLPEKPVTIT